jgi:ABC-type transport system involved in multi-copper enzyme maturation permease subunit
MALMPVVTREMSALARRQSTYWARAVTAVIAVLTMMWLLLVSAAHVSTSSLGTSIFFILSGFSFGFTLLVGMQATADSVSEEKREGTLGLLFLTDLRPMDIVLGKMAASSLNSFFAVLGVVPMLSLALLLGGVTLPQIGLVAIVLLNSMFLSLALGLFVSTLSKNERKAMFGCFFGLFIITLMPFVLSAAMNNFDKLLDEIVWVSPLYSFLVIQNSAGPNATVRYLAQGLIFQHLLGWCFLFAASRVLPRCINEVPARRFLALRQWMHNYVFGDPQVRTRYRAALLDRNAFLWLASRERVKPRYAWAVVGFFGLLFLWVYLQFPTMFFDPPVPLTIIFLVHLIFKLWTASEVCSRLIHDRRSGALELLLSSPLSVSEIAEGQGLALRRIFRRPLAVLIVAELLIMCLTWREAREDIARESIVLFAAAITTLLLDLWALKWVGLWLSLFGKSIERILIATLGRVLGVPSILVLLIGGTLSAIVALQNESIPALFGYSLYWSISIICALAFGFSAKRNFLRNFREAATQRFDSAPAKAERTQRAKKAAPRQPLWRAPVAAMRRHWVLTGSAALLAVLVLIPLSRQFYWKQQVAAELRRIRAEGQPANGMEIAKVYTPLTSPENAFARLTTPGAVNRRRWLPGINATRWFLNGTTNRAAILEECQQLVTNNQPNIAALRELPRFQKAYLDPEQLSSWMLPVDIAGYITLAAADARLALTEKNSERLEEDLRALIALARLLRSQPLTAMQAQARDALTVLTSVFEETFRRVPLSGATLLELQLQLEAVRRPEMLRSTLSLERARLIDGWGEIDPRFGPPPAPVAAAHGLLSAIGSYDQSLALTLDAFRKASEASAAPPHELLRSGLLYVGTPQSWGRMYGPWSNPNRPDLPTIVYNEASVRARLELLRAGIAVERFQIENHCFPETLAQLVPRYVESVPSDTLSGERFDSELFKGALQIRARELNLTRRNWSPEQLIFVISPIPLENGPRTPGE